MAMTKDNEQGLRERDKMKDKVRGKKQGEMKRQFSVGKVNDKMKGNGQEKRERTRVKDKGERFKC